MSKYSIYATRQDYDEAYKELQELETKSDKPFDWKKLKAQNLDTLKTLISAFKRQLTK